MNKTIELWLQRAIYACLALAAWEVTASLTFLWLSDALSMPGLTPLQRVLAWWLYWPAVGSNFIEMIYWAVAALPFPALLVAVFGRTIKQKTQAVTNSLYGNAAPATREQMVEGGFGIKKKL